MCAAPRVTRHTSIRYSSFSHTRVNTGQNGHHTHSHHLAAEMWTTKENSLLGKIYLSCSFYLCRFRKYVSYGFPIIHFCNPGVHYERSCIFRTMSIKESPTKMCYVLYCGCLKSKINENNLRDRLLWKHKHNRDKFRNLICAETSINFKSFIIEHINFWHLHNLYKSAFPILCS
jgi:hypothetical protein